MNTSVSFELAKLLKEKGFDEWCNHYYEHSLTESYNEQDGYSGPFGWKKCETNYQSGFHINNSKYDNSNEAWFLCSAPTIAEVVMWLYEKYGIWVYVDNNHIHKWWYCAHLIGSSDKYDASQYNSPTQAYEAAISYTLNNLI